MKYLKSLIFTFITFSLITIINGQNCSINLGDLFGNQNQETTLIEESSCKLIDSLPTDFRPFFKIYTFANYIHEESAGDDFITSNRNLALSNISTPFYLFFEKRTTSALINKVYIHYAFPSTGIFSCYTGSDFLVIIKEMEIIINKNSNSYIGIQASIYFLINEISKMKLCCQNSGFRTTCGKCPVVDPLNDIDERPAYLAKFDFIKMPVVGISNISKGSESRSVGSIIDYANKSFTLGGNLFNLKVNFEAILQSHNVKGWITSNDDICTKFDLVNSSYESEPNGIWFHIDQTYNQLYYKYKESLKEDMGFLVCFLSNDEKYSKYNPVGKANGLEVTVDVNGNYKNSKNGIVSFNLNNNKIVELNDAKHDGDNLKVYIDNYMESKKEFKNHKILFSISQATVDQWLAPVPKEPILPIKYLYPRIESNVENKGGGKNMDFWKKYIEPNSFYTSHLPSGDDYIGLDCLYFYHSAGCNSYVFNTRDFGNYIWGAAMKKLGFTVSQAKCWADKIGQTQGGPDTNEDQHAIQLGHENVIIN